jgi:UDP-glucose 4-epimerase
MELLRGFRSVACKKFRSVIFRYFNAAGADPEGRIGEWHMPETHLIPLAIEAARSTDSNFKVYGSDHTTRDGTCIRDFVHVCDLAEAHSRGIDHLIGGGESIALNLSTGHGTSVNEIIDAIELVESASEGPRANRNSITMTMISRSWRSRSDPKELKTLSRTFSKICRIGISGEPPPRDMDRFLLTVC